MKVFDVCKDMQESQLRTCHNMPVCLCVGFLWSWEISKADTNKKGNLEFVCFLFSGFAIFSLHFAWFVPIIPLFSSFCFQNFLLFSCIMYCSFCLYGFPFFSCFSLRQSKGKIPRNYSKKGAIRKNHSTSGQTAATLEKISNNSTASKRTTTKPKQDNTQDPNSPKNWKSSAKNNAKPPWTNMLVLLCGKSRRGRGGVRAERFAHNQKIDDQRAQCQMHSKTTKNIKRRKTMTSYSASKEWRNKGNTGKNTQPPEKQELQNPKQTRQIQNHSNK